MDVEVGNAASDSCAGSSDLVNEEQVTSVPRDLNGGEVMNDTYSSPIDAQLVSIFGFGVGGIQMFEAEN